MNPGSFIISLDFELLWGVQDSRDIKGYASNIAGVGGAVEHMLALFAEYSIHATWATVGFLFAKDVPQLEKFSPPVQLRPTYDDPKRDSYRCLEWIKEDPELENGFFAPELIRNISSVAGQEIASHTLSHYYCSEVGQTIEQFKADMDAAMCISAELFGVELKTMVFPRNQSINVYVDALGDCRMVAFRGLEEDWIHDRMGNSKLMRLFRLLDSYFPLTGQGGYLPKETSGGVVNLMGSRFLRPYNKKLAAFERLKMRRIKKQMRHAAKKGLVFHLWWHPHNFGVRQEYHMEFLREILDYYQVLADEFGMRSLNMYEAAEVYTSRQTHS